MSFSGVISVTMLYLNFWVKLCIWNPLDVFLGFSMWRIRYEFTIYYADTLWIHFLFQNSLWIYYLFHKFTINTFSLSEFTINPLSLSQKYFEFTVNWLSLSRTHFLPLYWTGIHYEFTFFLRIHYEFAIFLTIQYKFNMNWLSPFFNSLLFTINYANTLWIHFLS